MEKLVAEYTNQLTEALDIARNSHFKFSHKEIKNVLICGVGGSGIGGVVVSNIISKNASVPIITNNDYAIPSFVNEHTLVIISSYSGNTEETLTALSQIMSKGAEVACITSGGKVKEIADKEGYNYILLPGGNPPRACFTYSFVAQNAIFEKYGLITSGWEKEVEEAIQIIESGLTDIQSEAGKIAKNILGSIPAVYTAQEYSGIGKRFCQQLQENSKALCWSNTFPEMNHNEIVGWSKKYENISVIFLEFKETFYRTVRRMEFTKERITKYAHSINTVKSKGNSERAQVLYMVCITDWISVYLAQEKNVDPIAIEAIDALKAELSQLA
jgi:glucose/mannose-6-phosphate isomerase